MKSSGRYYEVFGQLHIWRPFGEVTVELDRPLDQLRAGDVEVVTKYDRLARSLKHVLEIVEPIERKGVGFRSLAEDIDTTMLAGRPVFHVFASIAEFERGRIAERARGPGSRTQAGQGRGTAAGPLALPAGRGATDAGRGEGAHGRDRSFVPGER